MISWSIYSSTVARILASCSARKAWSFLRNAGRLFANTETANRAALTAPAFPIAKDATGIPPGIWTVDNKESSPFSALFIGTPRTGSVVCAASTPARCAAPPAAPITTSSPRASAVEAH
jgi:hypothetical protein